VENPVLEACILKLSVSELSKSFGGKTVLNKASYSFEKGKIYGLLGRNGAGKTTLFNCLIGNLTYESGSVVMESDEGAPRPAADGDIGFVYAEPHLPEFMTGQEYIKFFISINKNKMHGEVDLDESFKLIDFDDDDRHKLIKEYSFGMKNKLQLLAFLILRPPVILLDEPLASFDVVAAMQIKELIKSTKQDHIIILSTHILQIAQDLCDEIVILHNGSLSELDSAKMHDKDFEKSVLEALKEE